MLPIHPGIVGVARFVTLGIALSLAGCMAPMNSDDGAEPQAEAAPLALAPGCKSDDDCRIVPDYCADCSCLALADLQAEPLCLGKELSCVLDPCANSVARCVQGGCVADAGELL